MANLLLRGTPLGEVKGVLFDKDGTLSNSEAHLIDLSKERLQEAQTRFKGGKTSKEEKEELMQLLSKAYGKTAKGIKPSGTLAVASRHDNLITMATVFCLLGETWPEAIRVAEEVFSVVEIQQSEASTKIRGNTLLPGAMRMLEDLTSQGIICALISNDTSSGIESFLLKNRLTGKLSPQFWSAENTPAKPHPDAIKGLCNLLGLHPNQCAMIGDADSDLRMAKMANIPIILGYISGWETSPHLTEHQNLIYHWNDLKVQATTKVAHELGTS